MRRQTCSCVRWKSCSRLRRVWRAFHPTSALSEAHFCQRRANTWGMAGFEYRIHHRDRRYPRRWGTAARFASSIFVIADAPGAIVSSWNSAGRTYGSTTFHADKLWARLIRQAACFSPASST